MIAKRAGVNADTMIETVRGLKKRVLSFKDLVGVGLFTNISSAYTARSAGLAFFRSKGDCYYKTKDVVRFIESRRKQMQKIKVKEQTPEVREIKTTRKHGMSIENLSGIQKQLNRHGEILETLKDSPANLKEHAASYFNVLGGHLVDTSVKATDTHKLVLDSTSEMSQRTAKHHSQLIELLGNQHSHTTHVGRQIIDEVTYGYKQNTARFVEFSDAIVHLNSLVWIIIALNATLLVSFWIMMR